MLVKIYVAAETTFEKRNYFLKTFKNKLKQRGMGISDKNLTYDRLSFLNYAQLPNMWYDI